MDNSELNKKVKSIDYNLIDVRSNTNESYTKQCEMLKELQDINSNLVYARVSLENIADILRNLKAGVTRIFIGLIIYLVMKHFGFAL